MPKQCDTLHDEKPAAAATGHDAFQPTEEATLKQATQATMENQATPIWKNPIAWSAAIVGNSARFWCMVALLLIFTSSALLQAFLDGARGLIGTILFLAIYQFIFLYALRKLYEEVRRLRK